MSSFKKLNRIVINYLAKMLNENKIDAAKDLTTLLYNINNDVDISILDIQVVNFDLQHKENLKSELKK